ncbi:MAG: CRISPR-associated endonuclease Cas2 [Alcanivoracaceae bacterium]
MASYLICYDISQPRRLARLHRYLCRYAFPLQYSVFLFVGDERALEKYLAAMKKLINEKEDDLRCYPLPQRGSRDRLGRPTMPEGIFCGVLPSEGMEPG